MLFSVVIPVYNVEKYLSKCVESILSQTFTDYEVILVDDGSTDASGVICDNYAKNYKQINSLHKLNGGQASARNYGIENAKGEYIIFLDSDDFILQDNFFMSLFEKTEDKFDLIFYKYQKFIDFSNELIPCSFSYANIDESDTVCNKFRKMVESDSFFGMAWIKVIKKSILIDKWVFFDANLICEDMDWNYKLVTSINDFTVIDSSFIAYRQRSNSVTSTLKIKGLTDFIYTLEKWSEKFNVEIYDESFRNVLLASMAKYYSNLLIAYTRITDNRKKEYVKRMKKLAWLLKYSMSKRPKMVWKIYKIFGFRLTTFALKLIDKDNR